MPSFDYAIKYRPHRFEDVVGQEHPVAFLSGRIAWGQKGRNVLLYGDYGSGKTTLVRIYAKALNCSHPTTTGSPCHDCIWCNANNEFDSGFHVFKYGKGFDVGRWVEEHNRSPTGGRNYTVLFFDEAHLLSGNDMDSILQATEEPKDRVIFCFATTELERIRPALLSRLTPLEVRALSFDLAMRLLRRVADAEGIAYDREALALLAGLKTGHSRDLLTGLQQLEDGGNSVTLERVRFVFDVDHGQVLASYFLALADGNLAWQTEIIFSWRVPTAEKPRWIQAYLTWLYYNKVLRMPLVLDGVIESISADGGTIVEAFCRRLGLPQPTELAPCWRSMMAFWPIMSADLDEAAVHLRLTLFHHLVNEELPCRGEMSTGTQPQIAIGVKASEPVVTSPTGGGASSIEGMPFPEPGWLLALPPRDPAFLRVEDARALINRGSFLIQEYGVLFNVCIELRPFWFGCETEREGRALVGEFCRELQAQVRAWRGGDVGLFACLTLFDRDENGMRARIVSHIPRPLSPSGVGADCVNKTAAWLSGWRLRLKIARVHDAMRFEAGPVGHSRALIFHWQKTLNLCAGLSEHDVFTDGKMGRLTPLLEVLGLPRTTGRNARPIDPPLIEASDALTFQAIATASRNRMEPLSAFDAQAWTVLRNGWEFKEQAERKRTANARKREVLAFEEIYGFGSEDARIAIEQLARQWPIIPEQRERDWLGWWPKAEA